MSRLGIIAVLPLRGISYLNTTHPSIIIYNLSTTKKWMQDTGCIPRVRVFRSMRRAFRLVPGIGYLAPGTRDLMALLPYCLTALLPYCPITPLPSPCFWIGGSVDVR
jgi:hypothetical protein